MSGIRTQTLVVIDIDCICSYESNYHTLTTTTAPHILRKVYLAVVRFQ
jgi:hypothetical protein